MGSADHDQEHHCQKEIAGTKETPQKSSVIIDISAKKYDILELETPPI
jgi:hypothetical protein